MLVTIPEWKAAADDTKAGVPVILGYDTTHAPLYPPEGLYVDGTAIYDQSSGKPRLLIQSGAGDVQLHGHTYAPATDPVAAGNLFEDTRCVIAKSIRQHDPALNRRKEKPHIYLVDPYDPGHKTPLLMVHGLQSTPQYPSPNL